MLEMNLQRFSHQDPTHPPIIPSGLPDKPGPKLVSTKGNVERLVVVLENDDNLKAATKRVLDDGNVPAVAATSGLMTWTGNSYIGFAIKSATALGVYVGKFDAQGAFKITECTATITAASN